MCAIHVLGWPVWLWIRLTRVHSFAAVDCLVYTDCHSSLSMSASSSVRRNGYPAQVRASCLHPTAAHAVRETLLTFVFGFHLQARPSASRAAPSANGRAPTEAQA